MPIPETAIHLQGKCSCTVCTSRCLPCLYRTLFQLVHHALHRACRPTHLSCFLPRSEETSRHFTRILTVVPIVLCATPHEPPGRHLARSLRWTLTFTHDKIDTDNASPANETKSPPLTIKDPLRCSVVNPKQDNLNFARAGHENTIHCCPIAYVGADDLLLSLLLPPARTLRTYIALWSLPQN